MHLVGILFPHINDDARSKSHQIYSLMFVTSCISCKCIFSLLRYFLYVLHITFEHFKVNLFVCVCACVRANVAVCAWCIWIHLIDFFFTVSTLVWCYKNYSIYNILGQIFVIMRKFNLGFACFQNGKSCTHILEAGCFCCYPLDLCNRTNVLSMRGYFLLDCGAM